MRSIIFPLFSDKVPNTKQASPQKLRYWDDTGCILTFFLGIDDLAETQELEVRVQTGFAILKVLSQLNASETHISLE